MRFPQRQKPPLGQQINWAHPLARGLVGCWLFNESSGLYVSDLSGKNNRGILTNGPLWVPGRSGPALFFGGTDDYVDIGSKSSLMMGTSPFSASAWFNTTDISLNTILAYFGYFETYAWMIIINDTLRVGAHNDLATCAASLSYADGKWHQVIAMRDNNDDGVIYVDGIEVKRATGFFSGFNSNVLQPFYIGRYSGGGYFNGLIDEVRIYNRALSAQEIWQLYTTPYAMFERRPVWMDYVAIGGLSIPVAMNHYRRLRA